MGVEQRGSTFRVRTRWSSLQLALTLRDEEEANDAFAALTWLRRYQRDDLLKAVGERPELILPLIAVHKAERLTARGLSLADLLPAKPAATPATITVAEAGARWVYALDHKLESVRERAYAPTVIIAYKRTWALFIEWLNTGDRRGPLTTVAEVNKRMLLDWRKHVEQTEFKGRTRSRATANRHLAIVSAWATWVRAPHGLGLDLPDHRISVSKGEAQPLPRALSPEAVSKLFQHLSPTHWKAVFTVLAETGVRAQECLLLKWSEVFLDLDALKLVEKTDRPLKSAAATREIPLSVLAKEHLERAFSARDKNSDSVWPPELRDRNAFESAWRRAVKKADVKARVHDLRHTRAVRWAVEEGVSEAEIRERLGHREASTTARYLKGANQYGRARARRATGPESSPNGV